MTAQPAPQIKTGPEVHVVPNHDASRFELWDGDEYIGFLGVERLEDGTVDLQHTIISEEFGRQGYARTLVTCVLEHYKDEGVKVRDTCSYVQDYMNRFPQYRDVLATSPDPRTQD